MSTEIEAASYEDNDTGMSADVAEDVVEADREDLPEEEDVQPDPLEQRFKSLEDQVGNLNGALRKERSTKQTLAKERDELARQLREIKEKLTPVEEDIDPEVDPIGALRQTKAQYAKLQQELQQARQTTQVSRQAEARLQSYQSLEAEYAATNPEYGPASEFLGEQLMGELADEGYAGAALEAEFGKRILTIADRAIENDQHPGEIIIKLARRKGFDPAKVAAPPEQKVEAKPNGAIQAQKKAMDQKSLSKYAGNGNNNANLEAKLLAAKPGSKEFDRILRELDA